MPDHGPGFMQYTAASFGVASHEPGESGTALLGRADTALDCAKRKGRNRVE